MHASTIGLCKRAPETYSDPLCQSPRMVCRRLEEHRAIPSRKKHTVRCESPRRARYRPVQLLPPSITDASGVISRDTPPSRAPTALASYSNPVDVHGLIYFAADGGVVTCVPTKPRWQHTCALRLTRLCEEQAFPQRKLDAYDRRAEQGTPLPFRCYHERWLQCRAIMSSGASCLHELCRLGPRGCLHSGYQHSDGTLTQNTFLALGATVSCIGGNRPVASSG